MNDLFLEEELTFLCDKHKYKNRAKSLVFFEKIGCMHSILCIFYSLHLFLALSFCATTTYNTIPIYFLRYQSSAIYYRTITICSYNKTSLKIAKFRFNVVALLFSLRISSQLLRMYTFHVVCKK